MENISKEIISLFQWPASVMKLNQAKPNEPPEKLTEKRKYYNKLFPVYWCILYLLKKKKKQKTTTTKKTSWGRGISLFLSYGSIRLNGGAILNNMEEPKRINLLIETRKCGLAEVMQVKLKWRNRQDYVFVTSYHTDLSCSETISHWCQSDTLYQIRRALVLPNSNDGC